MKVFVKCIVILVILDFILLFISGCNSKEDDNGLIKKINSEISYIDSEIIAIANGINNINYARYRVVTQEMSTNSGNGNNHTSDKKASEDRNSQESQTTPKEANSESESNESENESKTSDISNKIFSIQSNNILGKQEDINWEELKNKIESLYTTWTVVSLDLKEAGVSNELLQEFSNRLDLVTVSIKNENSEETLVNLVDLYEILPKFMELYEENDTERNVLYNKVKLLSCYKFATIGDWDNFKIAVIDLKNSFSNILNQKNEYHGKEINIESANVIINEIVNDVDLKDKEVFFIKYKNLIQEFNIILSI